MTATYTITALCQEPAAPAASPTIADLTIGTKIRSFDHPCYTDLAGPTAYHAEGKITDINEWVSEDGNIRVTVWFKPERVVFEGQDDSAEQVESMGIMMTQSHSRQTDRLHAGTLQIIG